MRTEKIFCDCCHKETQDDECLLLTLPIKSMTTSQNVLIAHEMEICLDCANKISMAYYEIAEKNGYSGIYEIRAD